MYRRIFSLFLVVAVFLSAEPIFVLAAEPTRNQIQKDITDLNTQIGANKSKIESLSKRIKNYERNLTEVQKQARTLQSELSTLQIHIDENSTLIEKNEAEQEAVNLEMKRLTLEILSQELLLAEKKKSLSQMIRQLERLQRRDMLDVLATRSSFSEFYTAVKQAEDVQKGIRQHLEKLAMARTILLEKKGELDTMTEELIALSESLTEKQDILQQQEGYKIALVAQTEASEDKYQKLLAEARAEQLSVSGELTALDKKIRQKLTDLQKLGRSNQGFVWPVTATRGVSAYFHDPSYPFRHIFEHPAIDIPASQGTIIRAPKDGLVARVKPPTGKPYAYIMIIHDDGLSTVYGHISCAKVVEEQAVRQGDPIGCVGGAPGTNGAGPLTTGAHLHFEVRKDGIPVDPMKYLP